MNKPQKPVSDLFKERDSRMPFTPASPSDAPAAFVQVRNPRLEDAAAMHELVLEDEVLDNNSCYAYLLLCRHHAETCLVAYREQTLVGLVTAYFPPRETSTIFVWQIAVSPGMRKQGLARRMLRHLLTLSSCRKASFLEATVAPSNVASRRMFHSLAEQLAAPFQVGDGFLPQHFPNRDCPPELLVRIGPLEKARENV